MGKNTSRAEFPSDLQALRETLATLPAALEEDPGWYGSVYFERKTSRVLAANLKNTQISDSTTMGAVLRIFNGETLFEQATDELTVESLKTQAKELIARVREADALSKNSRKTYPAPSWKDRLSQKLDPEILSQIPTPLTPATPVHFGIAYQNDPRTPSPSDTFDRLKTILEACKEVAHEVGIDSSDLTYVLARQTVAEEVALFIDREVNMSQTLLRVALVAITMSGAERTISKKGGLGGLEAIQISKDELRPQIKDLYALRNAERLVPGRYRVLFSPATTGVIAHEAFGHSQEGDTCARGRSKAWDLYKSGKKVGNLNATILNNPAIFANAMEPCAAWGSYFFDEEGWLAQEQVLLDQGGLCSPMTNFTSAIQLGVARTANGKRESWANGVYTRQTNTYFSAGEKTLAQLIVDLNDGYLAFHPAGGMEDPKGMGIQVGLAFLEEVKNGKRTGRYFKGPAGGEIQMTGYTPDILNSIIAKSKVEADQDTPDRAAHPYNDVGGCGKYHKELVQAGCGGPYILIENVILG
ncbi:TldD/PmbA family protein [Bdellovibrionota bacterium FG-2]